MDQNEQAVHNQCQSNDQLDRKAKIQSWAKDDLVIIFYFQRRAAGLTPHLRLDIKRKQSELLDEAVVMGVLFTEAEPHACARIDCIMADSTLLAEIIAISFWVDRRALEVCLGPAVSEVQCHQI